MMVITQKITSLAFEIHDGKNQFVSSRSSEAVTVSLAQGGSGWSFHSVWVCFSGMARKEEHLTPGQKILAIRFVDCGKGSWEL